MNFNRNIITRIPIECLLNNIIDKDFQAVLFPINIFQSLYLISNYNITNNFITPNNKTSYIKSFIGASILMIVNYYRFSITRATTNANSFFLLVLIWFDCVYFNVTIIVIYIVSAFQSSNTVLFIIKLQQVLRTVNIDRFEMMSKMKSRNWIHVICIVGVYISFTIITSTHIQRFRLSHLILMMPVFIFDLSIINASRTITFISEELAMWNNKMVNYEKVYLEGIGEYIEDDLTGKAMLNAYLDIIKSFRLAEKVFQFVIFYHTLETFGDSLVTVQSYIEYARLDPKQIPTYIAPLTRMMGILWIMKSFLLLTTLSNACEKVYKNVQIAETLCAKFLQFENKDLRKTCKNVVRFHRAAFRKLSAFGVLEVDATLPLRVLAAVLAYTVVLLQFAFL